MRERWARRGWSEAALRAAGGYALLAALATALALALRDGVPWVHPEPWVVEPLGVAVVSSAALGLAVATAIIAFTRVTVRRFGWARRLHSELRPVAVDLTLGQILVIAGLSSLGEELFFRGLLVPIVGVVPPALFFGLIHQMKGPSRWVWAGWATVVGLMLGAVFALTGSLVGPLLAHAIVNAANLAYLRDHDPAY
jgi:membrane protease YdiL (CAAX protease family)